MMMMMMMITLRAQNTIHLVVNVYIIFISITHRTSPNVGNSASQHSNDHFCDRCRVQPVDNIASRLKIKCIYGLRKSRGIVNSSVMYITGGSRCSDNRCSDSRCSDLSLIHI